MRNYVTEFIGTFFLVFTIGLAVTGGSTASPFVLAPLAIGSSLMIMVYMGGHISGGHYNPAVTLAVFLRGKLPAKDVAPYMVAQVAAAVVAALLAYGVYGKTVPIAPSVNVGSALLVEFLYTFALALVVLNAATAPKTAGNSFYGLAIGFTVVVAAIAGGAASGGAFNPAVGVGLSLVNAIVGPQGGSTLPHVWLYIVGPLAGGAAAALVYLFQNAEEAPAGSGTSREAEMARAR